MRARDQYISSTLIGGKGKAAPSLFHITLEGPTEHMNARLHGFLHGIEWIVFHGHSHYFQKPSLGGRPNTKLGDMVLRTLTTVDLFYSIMCEDPHE